MIDQKENISVDKEQVSELVRKNFNRCNIESFNHLGKTKYISSIIIFVCGVSFNVIRLSDIYTDFDLDFTQLI